MSRWPFVAPRRQSWPSYQSPSIQWFKGSHFQKTKSGKKKVKMCLFKYAVYISGRHLFYHPWIISLGQSNLHCTISLFDFWAVTSFETVDIFCPMLSKKPEWKILIWSNFLHPKKICSLTTGTGTGRQQFPVKMVQSWLFSFKCINILELGFHFVSNFQYFPF